MLHQVHYKSLVETNPNPILQFSRAGELLCANSAAQPLLESICHERSVFDSSWYKWLEEVISFGGGQKEVYVARQKIRLVASYCEETALVNVFGQELHAHSQIDALTSFPALSLFKHRLRAHCQALSADINSSTILVIVDIKQFKELNLRHGYATGDLVLKQLAERLQQCFPQALCMGRIAGNEFAVAYESVASSFDCLCDLDKRLEQLQSVMEINGDRLTIELVTGLVISHESEKLVDQMLAQAQLALNQAREKKLRQQIYCPSLAAAQHRKNCIREDIEEALISCQFHLVFEPQVSLQSGVIRGAEALLRWQHPELGNISPIEFIPIAEQTGKITQLTRWVLCQVFQYLVQWKVDKKKLLPISVNISAQDLLQPDLLDILSELSVRDASLLPWLQLEITETCLLSDMQRGSSALEAIKRHGIKISIDDFGTGYSSLSYISQLSADKLKIDRSFISQLFLAPDNQLIVNSILDLARSLNLVVCAEGVETEQQCQYLKGRGCIEAQGRYFSAPISEVQFSAMLGHENPLGSTSSLASSLTQQTAHYH